MDRSKFFPRGRWVYLRENRVDSEEVVRRLRMLVWTQVADLQHMHVTEPSEEQVEPVIARLAVLPSEELLSFLEVGKMPSVLQVDASERLLVLSRGLRESGPERVG